MDEDFIARFFLPDANPNIHSSCCGGLDFSLSAQAIVYVSR